MLFFQTKIKKSISWAYGTHMLEQHHDQILDSHYNSFFESLRIFEKKIHFML